MEKKVELKRSNKLKITLARVVEKRTLVSAGPGVVQFEPGAVRKPFWRVYIQLGRVTVTIDTDFATRAQAMNKSLLICEHLNMVPDFHEREETTTHE